MEPCISFIITIRDTKNRNRKAAASLGVEGKTDGPRGTVHPNSYTTCRNGSAERVIRLRN